METGNDRLRNIMRETQNISETSTGTNTYNIQIYENSNNYFGSYYNYSRDRLEPDNNLEATRNLTNENTRENITNITTRIIPLRSPVSNRETITQRVNELINQNIRNILGEDTFENTTTTNLESPREPSSTPALRSLEINSLINGERPLTLNTLNNKTEIFIYKQTSTEDQDRCSICNELYRDNDICRKNSMCNHFFHQKCIDIWYSDKNVCPVCNQHVQ